MSIKEKLKNPFVRQYIVEILFPILGYFFFNWSLTVIAVFYLLDQLSAEILFVRRLHWINSKSKKAKISFILPLSIIIIICLLSFEFIAGTNLWLSIYDLKEITPELMVFVKEELWVIFPLVLLMYYVKDSFTFYMPRRYLNYDVKKTLFYKSVNTILLIALLLMGLFLWSYVQVNEIIILFSFIFLKLGFDFSITKWTNRKSLIS